MVNWINGFDAGNKKEKYQLEFRLGTFTILELKWEKSKFRFMLLNLGFEIWESYYYYYFYCQQLYLHKMTVG